MKKLVITIWFWIGLLCSSLSCSKWFDISPKTDLKAGDLFETESGFESALAGVYVSLTSGDVYGDAMTFGLLDQLAQMYDYLPNGAQDLEDIYNYQTYTDLGFNTKSRLDRMWIGAYKAIANVNNLLKWLDLRGQQVIKSQETLEMMYGEAYALRAYLHFDLLRCWGPTEYVKNKGNLSIPYRLVADNSKQKRLPAERIVEQIFKDLDNAERHLRFESGKSLADSNRRFRFNYYAVKALQARIYLYVGDSINAGKAAETVISGCGLTLKTENQNDPILFRETLCGLSYYKMSEGLGYAFAEGPDFTTQYSTSFVKYQRMLGGTGTSADADIRVKSGAILIYNAANVISRKYIKNDSSVIPLIRLPEMYYILCECSPLDNAARYINEVRSKRGYTSAESYGRFDTREDLIRALSEEYRKEFYAEGQYFFFLKRTGIKALDYSDITLKTERFEFPIPDREIEYGWTEVE